MRNKRLNNLTNKIITQKLLFRQPTLLGSRNDALFPVERRALALHVDGSDPEHVLVVDDELVGGVGQGRGVGGPRATPQAAAHFADLDHVAEDRSPPVTLRFLPRQIARVLGDVRDEQRTFRS